MYGLLKNQSYVPRIIEPILNEALEDFGGVCIQGPKYCGKTWTGRALSNSEITFMPTEASAVDRELIKADPHLALRGDSPRLIDEWQEIPEIWDIVRATIDASGKERTFVLTGSATPRKSRPAHSGVGRIEKITMRPMTLFESGHSAGTVSLAGLFRGQKPSVEAPLTAIEDLATFVVRGGWPGTLRIPSARAGRLAASYVKSFLEEDMHKVDEQKRDPAKMFRLMQSYARNMEQAATPKTLIRDMTADAVSEPLAAETVDDYTGVLRSAFILEEVFPWAPNVRSKYRISKKPKYHYVDPSLPAAILRLTPNKLMSDFETFGFLFESMCVRDILVYAQVIRAKVFYYRDQSGLEADVIIEDEDGRWGAIEIKLGHHQTDTAASNLNLLRNRLVEAGSKPPTFLAVVEGVGSYAYQRTDGVSVVPIRCLCP